MGQKKRTQKSQSGTVNAAEEFKARAKKSALEILRKCFVSTTLSSEDRNLILEDVSSALGVEQETPTHAEPLDSSPRASSRIGSEKRRSTRDEHNEACEVCEIGGDLLCCDTCSLVFHLKCIRPKLSAVPKGTWSCAQCVLDGLASGDVDASKMALRAMARLGSGDDSGAEEAGDEPGTPLGLRKLSYKSRVAQVVVAQSGKKFAVRQIDAAREHVVELGRFASLEEALRHIEELVARTRSATKAATRKKRRDAEEAEQEEDDEDDELWCSHCIDDDRVIFCAFCGCKKCHGKFDSQLLILCDHCEREIHTYCFDPPLQEVPDTDPWYCCGLCTAEAGGDDSEDSRREEKRRGVEVADEEGAQLSGEDLSAFSGSEDRDRKPREAENDGEDRESGLSAGGAALQRLDMKRHNSVSSTASVVTVGGTHRGRGRPPGPKRPGEEQQEPSSADKRALQAAALKKASMVALPVAGAGAPGALSRTPSGSDAAAARPAGRKEEPGAPPAAKKDARLGMGIDSAIHAIGKFSRRLLKPHESEVLSQVRQWAPLGDLELAMAMLQAQRASLTDRIRHMDPSFGLDDGRVNAYGSSLPLPGSLGTMAPLAAGGPDGFKVDAGPGMYTIGGYAPNGSAPLFAPAFSVGEAPLASAFMSSATAQTAASASLPPAVWAGGPYYSMPPAGVAYQQAALSMPQLPPAGLAASSAPPALPLGSAGSFDADYFSQFAPQTQPPLQPHLLVDAAAARKAGKAPETDAERKSSRERKSSVTADGTVLEVFRSPASKRAKGAESDARPGKRTRGEEGEADTPSPHLLHDLASSAAAHRHHVAGSDQLPSPQQPAAAQTLLPPLRSFTHSAWLSAADGQPVPLEEQLRLSMLHTAGDASRLQGQAYVSGNHQAE